VVSLGLDQFCLAPAPLGKGPEVMAVWSELPFKDLQFVSSFSLNFQLALSKRHVVIPSLFPQRYNVSGPALFVPL